MLRKRQGRAATCWSATSATLIAGFRELKQHRGRREAFLEDQVARTTESVRLKTVGGLTGFAVAEGWSQFAVFAFIGFLLFVIPLAPADPATLDRRLGAGGALPHDAARRHHHLAARSWGGHEPRC